MKKKFCPWASLMEEIRDFRVFKRDSFYVAAFDQRFKSNGIDNIRLVRIYLTKKKEEFKIAREKWHNTSWYVGV